MIDLFNKLDISTSENNNPSDGVKQFTESPTNTTNQNNLYNIGKSIGQHDSDIETIKKNIKELEEKKINKPNGKFFYFTIFVIISLIITFIFYIINMFDYYDCLINKKLKCKQEKPNFIKMFKNTKETLQP